MYHVYIYVFKSHIYVLSSTLVTVFDSTSTQITYLHILSPSIIWHVRFLPDSNRVSLYKSNNRWVRFGPIFMECTFSRQRKTVRMLKLSWQFNEQALEQLFVKSSWIHPIDKAFVLRPILLSILLCLSIPSMYTFRSSQHMIVHSEVSDRKSSNLLNDFRTS